MVDPVSVLFGGIPVRDFEAAAQWYERLLERPPDMRPHDHEVVWKVGDGGWIYVVRDPQRAGNALITIIGDQLPPFDGKRAEEGGFLTVEVTDPEGNRIKFGRPAA